MKARRVIGWREWVGLPSLGIDKIKAKIDTGARTSTLHALDIRAVRKRGVRYVRFSVHPVQRRRQPVVECLAPIVEEREIRNSGGKVEKRFVVAAKLQLDGRAYPVELTLTNRDVMGFRMLIGRAALRGRYLVDPGRSYLADLAGI